MTPVQIREFRPTDMDAISRLHAQSWSTAYRGILLDSYLDHEVESERKSYWKAKIPQLTAKDFMIIAEQDGDIVGFAAVMDKPDNGYDALLDNLHVRPDLKGQGVGGRLMKAVAARLQATGRNSFYLWVLHGNEAAAEFYKAKGGTTRDTGTVEFGGKTVGRTRFIWTDLDALSNSR